jgi:hypothetical protein
VSDFIRILLAVTNATSPIKFLYIVLFLSSELPRERFFHRSRGMEQSENIHALYAFDFFRSGFFDGPASQRQHCNQARGFHRIRLSVSYLHHKSMTTSS